MAKMPFAVRFSCFHSFPTFDPLLSRPLSELAQPDSMWQDLPLSSWFWSFPPLANFPSFLCQVHQLWPKILISSLLPESLLWLFPYFFFSSFFNHLRWLLCFPLSRCIKLGFFFCFLFCVFAASILMSFLSSGLNLGTFVYMCSFLTQRSHTDHPAPCQPVSVLLPY